MEEPTIRPADPDEAEAIQELGRAAWHAAYDDVLGRETVDRTIDEWWAVESLRGGAAADERVFLVADSGGALVGVADAGPDPTRDATWRLGRLYVHPDRWGEGLGTRLVDALRERLPTDAERLRLVVLAENGVGVSFYEGYGFELIDSRVGETDGLEHEEYVYELRL